MTRIRAVDEMYLARIVQEVHSVDELRTKLSSGRQLRIKFGVDCTAPHLHLGHAVNLHLLRHFQEAGHRVQLLLGTFTTRIGDPTGRNDARPMLTEDEIERNAAAFVEQAGTILLTDSEHLTIYRNNTWFDRMPLHEFLSLASTLTTARLLSRETFKKRLELEGEVRVHEMLYPLLQARDSVELASDVAPVGTDQLFNEMLGRELQARFGQEKQIVITTRITPGLDGVNKQSKSLNNYVALTDTPRDKFGKVMSLPDELIGQWMEVYTELPLGEVREIVGTLAAGTGHPRDAKLLLARKIVERYHGVEAGRREEQWFLQTFSRREIPDDLPLLEVTNGEAALDVIRRVLPGKSNTELRTLLKQGAVSLDGEKLELDASPQAWPEGGTLKVGKRGWFKLVRRGAPPPGTEGGR